MRGTVIASTDEEGNIVETYNYDPFGNLLSNPSIYNPKLYIGRDDVLYDSETKLYYMHARYYDPEAGRFIMKDPVSGSLSNPINKRFRIKCGMTGRGGANDPINKIDPAGTTPQNTGLPPRYENEPQAVKWAGSNRTAFCTPAAPGDSKLFRGVNIESGQEGTIKLWSPEDGYGNDVWGVPNDAMDTFDSCDRTFDRGTVTMGEYEITYGWDINGKPYVSVKPKKGGKGTEATAEAIERGMNDALGELYNQGYFNFNTLGSLVNDVTSFMSSGGWGELAKVKPDFKDPYTAFYHVTIGAAIASEMGPVSATGVEWSETELSKKEFGNSGRKWTEKDLKILIGTGVSYYNKQNNTQLGFYYSTDVWRQTTLGLVDVANLILATMRWESGFNPDDVGINSGSIDVGLMQINLPNKSEKQAREEGWFNPFKNVMGGIDTMFRKLQQGSSWPSAIGGPPTQYEWMQASWYYQGGGVNRDKVWADLQRLSATKHYGYGIIWNWDPLYVGYDEPFKLPGGRYKRWKKGEKKKRNW